MEAASRELQEETGATDFTLQPVCWYSAWRADDVPHSCGLLCVADVHALGEHTAKSRKSARLMACRMH